jgi:uncharacterized membrane-anchored protein
MINKRLPSLLIGLALHALSAFAAEQQDAIKSKLVQGPAKVSLDKVSSLALPAGYNFLDGKSTRELMEAVGEPTSGQEMGMIMPTNREFTVVFEFSEIGFVKDDDKDKLDADKLLDSIRKGTAEANKMRAKAGNPPLEIVGWEIPPKYERESHNLEWAIRATSGGEPLLNYNTRLLGRKGVMEVVLIVDPDRLSDTLPEFRKVLAAHAFQTGESYAEYRPGDKVAKYGLAALVVGGAAVGAAKLGLFATLAVLLKKAWKLIVVAVVAVAGGIKKMFGGRGEQRVE